MGESELYRMYQAWQQGNDDYIRDWARFVEWAASWNGSNSERILVSLEKCKWFRKGY